MKNKSRKIYGLYDVCQCNHESLQHNPKCSANVPVGKESYRGYVAPEILSKVCSCKKFKFSEANSANIFNHEKIESGKKK